MLAAAPMAASAAPPAGKDVNLDMAPVGIPMGSATMKKPWDIEFATPPAVKGGAPVIMTVSVTNLPAQMPGESAEAASKRKADTLAADINKVLPKVGGNPAASVTQKNVMVVIGVNPPVIAPNGRIIKPATPIFGMVKQSFLTVNGLYTVPASKGNPGTPAVKQLTNPTLEFGDGMRLAPGAGGGGGPPPPSPGYKGSMSGSGMSASGRETTGAHSFVYLGVADDFVGGHVVDFAGVRPYTGESDSAIMQSIGLQLDDEGLKTYFDSVTDTLDIVSVIPQHDTMIFGNTDTGLGLSFDVIGAPEPGVWALLLLGVGAVGLRLRRSRRARGATLAEA